MSITPSASAGRGDIILQPAFFTSSLYVLPFRDDIRSLIHAFHEKYVLSSEAPFALFKTIWCAQYWHWLQFKVFDDRSRETFLNVSHRLFLERTVKTEAPFTRVVALFGLYTFFYSQLSGTILPLHTIKHIPIPLDQYTSLLLLPNALTTEQLLPLQPYASYVLKRLVTSQVFQIIPTSELHAYNPRQLPREMYIDSLMLDSNGPIMSKKGRPTKRDRAKKTKAALESLDKWMHKTSVPIAESSDSSSRARSMHYLLTQPPTQSLGDYQSHKFNLLKTIDPQPGMDRSPSEGHVAIEKVSQDVLERLRQMEETQTGNRRPSRTGVAGIERVERAMRATEGGLGLLGLTEGAGR